MKKNIMVFIALIISIMIFNGGCRNQENDIIENLNINKCYFFLDSCQFENRGFTKILDDYTSEISMCLEDNNGIKTLFLFSTPINYYNNYGYFEYIDTSIKNIENQELLLKGYIYQTKNSDIMTYYPEYISKDVGITLEMENQYEFGIVSPNEIFSKYSEIKTFIGDKRDGIIYEDAFGKDTFMQSYPTNLGTSNEVIISKLNEGNTSFSFWLNTNDLCPRMEPGGYILLLDKNDGQREKIIGIIQPPLLKDNNGNISVDNRIELVEHENGAYTINIDLDKDFISSDDIAYPIVFDMCFEMRKEKQPDTQVYSKMPELNTYLRNYTIIGDHPNYGDCRCYNRFQFMNDFGLKAEQILSVNFFTYNLSNVNNNILFYRVNEDWCSLTSNWNTNIKYDGIVMKKEALQGVNKFDITNIAKEYVRDDSGVLQNQGLLMASDDSAFSVFTSADSTLFPVRCEIVFK